VSSRRLRLNFLDLRDRLIVVLGGHASCAAFSGLATPLLPLRWAGRPPGLVPASSGNAAIEANKLPERGYEMQTVPHDFPQ
jgi:hypothetical protein